MIEQSQASLATRIGRVIVFFVLAYVTAYQVLHRSAQVQRGQRILVHGAGGAVGTAMLQLGRLLDLEMYGTASSPSTNWSPAWAQPPLTTGARTWTVRRATAWTRSLTRLAGTTLRRNYIQRVS
jgi:hypothetical protein